MLTDNQGIMVLFLTGTWDFPPRCIGHQLGPPSLFNVYQGLFP